jgi:porphobilinogen synthase
LVQETRLHPADFIYPLFIAEGSGVRRPVSSMPGIFNLSIDQAVLHAREAYALGVKAVLLFGIPDRKDATGTSGTAADGIVPRAIRALKSTLPDLLVIADICLCEYTDHGHCGVLQSQEIDNDATLPLLAQMAVSCARAGADIVAPSDMMDGRVGVMRRTLDEAGLLHTPILSYAAKYASGFYGPFREAAGSTPQFGDRRGYQMDPANAREALREVEQDLAEGAELILVKPALPYLDVLAQVRAEFSVPLFAYNVSGEYAMLKAAAQAGWLDYDRVMLETLTSIKRAGADRIVTYHALEAARLL